MYIFLTIFFLLFPFFQSLFEKNEIKKINMLLIFLSFFATLQFFISPFTISKSINYLGSIILTSIIVCLWFIGFFALFTYLIYKKKLIINKENVLYALKNTGMFYGFIIPFIIFILFMRNIFLDTTAYLTVSGYFKNNFYTFNGITEISVFYRSSASYFVYPSLASNFAPFYLFFNIFVYGFIIFYLINFFNWKNN